jgi:predicted RNA methylase
MCILILKNDVVLCKVFDTKFESFSFLPYIISIFENILLLNTLRTLPQEVFRTKIDVCNFLLNLWYVQQHM